MDLSFEEWRAARGRRGGRARDRAPAERAVVDAPYPARASRSAHVAHEARAAHAARLLARARELVAEASAILEPLVVSSARQDDAALVDAVEVAERISAAAFAAQTRASVAYRGSQIERQRDLGVPPRELGRGVSDELALARRVTPTRASAQLALGRVLVESLPRTFGLLEAGEISAWAADEVAKAVLVLDDDDRATVDADLAPRLPAVSARTAGKLARARANELDQEAALARARREEAQRHVSIRPASDTMVRVSALLPTAQGVAVFAALDKHAASARAAGSEKSRGQEMADALFSRVTGLARAEDATVEIQLLMTDTALLSGGADTAWIDGQAIPAAIARRFALGGDPGRLGTDPAQPGTDPARLGTEPGQVGSPGAAPGAHPPGTSRADLPERRFIRRLYTDPVTGALRDADSRRRAFTGALRTFIAARDQGCRGPWCDSRGAHVHHVQAHAAGGSTSIANGVSTCARLNYTAEMPGWSTGMTDGGALRITTPSGREYTSLPPPLRRPAGAQQRPHAQQHQPCAQERAHPPRPAGNPTGDPARARAG